MTAQLEQGSPEWFAARCGLVTASRISDLIARTKSGWGASRGNYMASLIAERLTGVPQDTYQNAAMIHGIETEPQARAAYEFFTDTTVEQVGFVKHPVIGDSGASPDGLVGTDGLVEIKCPNTATHINTLLSGTVETKYIVQMHWQMVCADRKWCDFVSYDPRLPSDLSLFVKRINCDGTMIAELEKAVVEFLDELDAKLAALRKLRAAA